MPMVEHRPEPHETTTGSHHTIMGPSWATSRIPKIVSKYLENNLPKAAFLGDISWNHDVEENG